MDVTNRITELRQELANDGVDTDLSDGEIEDMFTEAEQNLPWQQKQLQFMDTIVKRLETMTRQKVRVDVRGEPMEKAALALQTIGEGLVKAVERALREPLETIEKSLRSITPPSVTIEAPAVPQVTIDMALVAKSLETLSRAIEKIVRPAPPPKISVQSSSPSVTFDNSTVAKAISDLALAIESSRIPGVFVEPSKSEVVVHVHMPRVKCITQQVVRDSQGNMTGSESVYEYEETS